MKNKGNFLLEYSVLIAIIIAALLCMQGYVKRALSDRWRQSADTFAAGRQYEPGVSSITKGVR